jgi:hypothetical protein
MKTTGRMPMHLMGRQASWKGIWSRIPSAWLLLVLLGVFAVYAPAVRLPLLHDDALIVLWLDSRNPFTVFINNPVQDGNYRPLGGLLWILVRDFFGWYLPPLIHIWNVWLHVLNTALAAALAQRLNRRFGWPHSGIGAALPILSALIFGLFPFSYQDVLWAGAVFHPLMTAMGLAGIYVCLMARTSKRRILWAPGALLLLSACLSHESGFIFAAMALVIEGFSSGLRKSRLSVASVVAAAPALLYPLAYRLWVRTFWSAPGGLGPMFGDLFPNLIYFAQGMISWLLILLRTWIGLSDAAVVVIALFVASVGLALIILYRWKVLALGLLGLIWWFVAVLPSAALLSESYVRLAPRLMYAPAVGIAIFWGGLLAGLFGTSRRRLFRGAMAALVIVLLAWCVPFITDRQDETARLTPAMNSIEADLKKSDPATRVLLINMPWWSAPAYPAFPIGAEGMPIYQHGNAPHWSWLATVSGTRRETTVVRHDISLTRGERWMYGNPGDGVDDASLRQFLLRNDYVYRFDYDAPGLRARRLAAFTCNPVDGQPLARLTYGDAQVSIHAAQASICDAGVEVSLTWSDASHMTGPAGIFVHVYDDQGRQIMVADRDLADGYLPLELLPADRAISETREIRIPAGIADAVIREVRVGVYDRASAQRYTAKRADSSAWDGNEIVLPAGNTALCH